MPGGTIDAQALREARLRAGITQHDLSNLIGVAGGVRISQWERGVQTPRPEITARLADALQVPVSELLVPRTRPDLRELRLAAGLPLRAVAEHLSMPASTYAHWEGGARKTLPGEGVLARLAECLGTDPDAVRGAFERTIERPRHRRP